MSEKPDETKFTFGAVVAKQAFVLSIDRQSGHLIVYTTIEGKPEIVGNGTWTGDDVDGGVVNEEYLTEEVCAALVEAIKQSTFTFLPDA